MWTKPLHTVKRYEPSHINPPILAYFDYKVPVPTTATSKQMQQVQTFASTQQINQL